jgi:hypothetical protein
MKLPTHYPKLLREIAEHGYTAQSGNSVRIEIAAAPKKDLEGRKTWMSPCWKRRPSEEDKREFEQILSSVANVHRLSDLAEVGPEGVVQEMKQVLGLNPTKIDPTKR